VDVAEGGGEAKHLQLRRPQRDEDGHRVICSAAAAAAQGHAPVCQSAAARETIEMVDEGEEGVTDRFRGRCRWWPSSSSPPPPPWIPTAPRFRCGKLRCWVSGVPTNLDRTPSGARDFRVKIGGWKKKKIRDGD
jgi:hypothetical protein